MRSAAQRCASASSVIATDRVPLPHDYRRDGHHRISVARMVGQQEIDANVTIWNVN